MCNKQREVLGVHTNTVKSFRKVENCYRPSKVNGISPPYCGVCVRVVRGCHSLANTFFLRCKNRRTRGVFFFPLPKKSNNSSSLGDDEN